MFFSASSIAGAFSGLLAFAIAKMDGVANLEGWRWIFILEGLLTVSRVSTKLETLLKWYRSSSLEFHFSFYTTSLKRPLFLPKENESSSYFA